MKRTPTVSNADLVQVVRRIDRQLADQLGRKHDEAITAALAEVADAVANLAQQAWRTHEVREDERERWAEQRRQAVESDLHQRVGRLLYLLSHHVTLPQLERAVELAPSREVGHRDWADALGADVLTGDPDAADRLVAELRKPPRSEQGAPSRRRGGSRGGVDPVVAFLAGGAILGGWD